MKAGGKRKGAGRKPLPFTEKKTTLKLYLKNGVVENLGGAEKLTDKLLTYIEELNKA